MMSDAKYKIIREIGKGAYGTAYIVQLKKVRMAKQTLKERQGSLLELRLLSSFKHRNILGFYESWVEGGCVACLLVELCEAGDLSTQLRLRLPTMNHFPEQHLHEILVQLASGLHYLHQSHIVHRDIKSGNIFITAEGCLKLADFGLAAVLEAGNVIGTTLVGTPGCMAPQMLADKVSYDPYKNDMYGLGVLMHEVSALKPPFSGALNMEALARKVTSGAVPPLPSQYSDQWKSLIKSLLSQEEASRPSAGDILALPWLQEARQRVESRFGPELLDADAAACVELQPLPIGVQSLADMFEKQQKDAEEKKERDKARLIALQAKYAPKGLLQKQAQQDLKDWQKEQGKPCQPQAGTAPARPPLRRTASTIISTPRDGARDAAALPGTGPGSGAPKLAARRATASGAPLGSAAAVATAAAAMAATVAEAIANGRNGTLLRCSDAGLRKDHSGRGSLRQSRPAVPKISLSSQGALKRPESAPASPNRRKSWNAVVADDSEDVLNRDDCGVPMQHVQTSSHGGSSSSGSSSACPGPRETQEQEPDSMQEDEGRQATCVHGAPHAATGPENTAAGKQTEQATPESAAPRSEIHDDICSASAAEDASTSAAHPPGEVHDITPPQVYAANTNATAMESTSHSGVATSRRSTGYGRSGVQRSSTAGTTPREPSSKPPTTSAAVFVRRCSTGNMAPSVTRAAVGQTSIVMPPRTSAVNGSQGRSGRIGYAQRNQVQANPSQAGGWRVTAPGSTSSAPRGNSNGAPPAGPNPEMKFPLRASNNNITSILASRPSAGKSAPAVPRTVLESTSARRQSAGTVQIPPRQDNRSEKVMTSAITAAVDSAAAGDATAGVGVGVTVGVSKAGASPATPRTLGLHQSKQAQEWLARQLQAVEETQASV